MSNNLVSIIFNLEGDDIPFAEIKEYSHELNSYSYKLNRYLDMGDTSPDRYVKYTPLTAAIVSDRQDVALTLLNYSEVDPGLPTIFKRAKEPTRYYSKLYSELEEDYRGSWGNKTPLMLAVRYGRKKIVNALLKSGRSNPNFIDDKGNDALMLNSSPKITKLLIDSGYYNLDGPNMKKYIMGHLYNLDSILSQVKNIPKDFYVLFISQLTFDEYIDEKWFINILEKYRKHIDINAVNSERETAIMLISYWDLPKLGRKLIEYGADLSMKDDEGKTALIYAVEGYEKDMVRILLGSGKDTCILCKDNYGKTALDYADDENRDKLKQMIEDHISKVFTPLQQNIITSLHHTGRYKEHKLYEDVFPSENECTQKTTRNEMLSYVKQRVTNMKKTDLIDSILKYGRTHDIQTLCHTDLNFATRSNLLERCSIQELVRVGKLIVSRMSHTELCNVLTELSELHLHQ